MNEKVESGLDVVAWRYTSSHSFGRKDQRWHYQENFPEAGARQVQEIGQLEALVRQSDAERALQLESEETLKAAGHIGAELGAAIAENERLRGLLRDTASVAITMLYDSHKADVLAEFKVPELEAVVEASKHLQSHRVEHVYRRAWDGALSQQAEPVEPAPAQDELDRLRALSVENVLLDVVPGDGSGHEVYAKSVADVSAELTKYVDRIEELESELAARPAQTEQQPCEAEEWRSVDGYEGLYSVSSLGRLRSDRTGKYLSLNSRVASGYVKADMHKDGEKKQTTVHRLVAQAFLERPEGADEVNHINGDKLDNRVSNLAWCSRRENVNHGYYELGHLVHRVKAIPIEGNGPELVFASIEQAVANGFHSGGIYTCLGQPHRYHLGYYWRSLKDAAPIAQTATQTAPDFRPQLSALVKACQQYLDADGAECFPEDALLDATVALERDAHAASVRATPSPAMDAKEE